MNEALVLETIRSTDTRIFNGDGCGIEWIWDRVNERYGVESTPRSYFERGTLGHAMIEAHLNNEDPGIVMADYVPPEGDWLETTKCTKEGMIEECGNLFESWLTQYASLEEYQGWDNVETEVTLLATTPNGVRISTEADAIFTTIANGNVALADWKLGTSKSGKAMQLYVYWYCMKQNGYVAPGDPFRAWFHYPSYSKPIVHIKDYPGDKFIEAYIDNAQIQRTEGPYLPNPDWFRCSQCEWKDKCPLWGGDWDETRKIEVIVV